MKYSITAIIGAALSVCGTGAKFKMNVMDTLGTMKPLRATINNPEYTGFTLMGVIFNFIDM